MKDILKALELQRNGHHIAAANSFQRAGNAERPLKEKEALWKQAAECRRIHNSD